MSEVTYTPQLNELREIASEQSELLQAILTELKINNAYHALAYNETLTKEDTEEL